MNPAGGRIERVYDAKETLQRLINRLNRSAIRLEDPTKKESHTNKSLMNHVEECWSLADKILRKLGLIEEEIRSFAFSLCVAHDIGKLDKRWRIGTGGPHAQWGGELLWEIEDELQQILPLPAKYQAPLILATLKHHSSLYIDPAQPRESKLGRDFRSLLKPNGWPNIALAVKIADAIGVFKLADILSALNLSSEPHEIDKFLSQYDWSDRFEAAISNGVKSKAAERRGFDPEKYELQGELASSTCRHLAIVAPTGWGKTALALLRIKHMKPTKIFYILPTITAIRNLEQTLGEIFGPDYVGEYFYFSDVEYLARAKEERFYPLDFYRFFIPKIMITTIDQLLLTTLQFGKYHLRRFNLNNSLLIFDEFHLFTPEMIGALKAVLEGLFEVYNFSVLLMSATPSTSYLSFLESTLRERSGFELRVLESEYKSLRRHKIEVTEELLLDFIRHHINKFKGRRVLVVSNTVDRAVEAYDLLRGEGACIIHSRFTYGDRRRVEGEINASRILVATQVAEVSLDISYDILITELAPIPSLIQRFGRVNRYGTHSKEVNVYVCAPESEKPYSYTEMKLAEEILPEFKRRLSEEGESAYLGLLANYYKELFVFRGVEKAMDGMYRAARRALEAKEYFYCFSDPEEHIARKFRSEEEPSFIALPSSFRDRVMQLKEEVTRADSYQKRRELLAEMKNYFLSVPLYIIRGDGKWDQELHLYIVGCKSYEYDPERGLIKK
jgi:CRISPR-associated endonuclease/helicase Cas3